jgi:hypothetical protein
LKPAEFTGTICVSGNTTAKPGQPSALSQGYRAYRKIQVPCGNTETAENKKTLKNGRRTYVQLEGFQKRPGMHLRWRDLKATAKDRGKNDGQHDGRDRLRHQANQAQCGVR